MNKILLLIATISALVLAFFLGTHHGAHDMTAAPKAAEKEPLYWYDPMRPDQHFEKPGPSPFMDMQLVPKYGDGRGAQSGVQIDARMAQNLGIRTATVIRGTLTQTVEAPGTVMADETRIEAVQTRGAGWIEHLHVHAVGDRVRRGQLLAEIYAPDLLAAQEEFLLAQSAHDAALTQSARLRLDYLGIGAAQIAQLQRSGKAQRTVQILAPHAGVVLELGAREGAQLVPGATLFKLADLSQVWMVAEIPENQTRSVTQGTKAQAHLAAMPDRTFSGHVEYIYPEVVAQTRTQKIRLLFDNPQQQLKPGQYATITFKSVAREALLISSEALIRTGTRSVVIVADDSGHYAPAEVTIGAQAAGNTEILSGLREGQRVVASGQFLLDSEANFRATVGRMGGGDKP